MNRWCIILIHYQPIVSGKFFNFFRNFAPQFPEKKVRDGNTNPNRNFPERSQQRPPEPPTTNALDRHGSRHRPCPVPAKSSDNTPELNDSMMVAFATRFPVREWPSGRLAIQLTNKTSELVAIIR